MNEIEKALIDGFKDPIKKYAESPATTNAGAVIRFLAKYLPVGFIVQILHQKLKKC
jgi:hypothetical protein